MKGENMECQNEKMILISGDIFSLDVEIIGADVSVISSVWISSERLSLNKKLTYNNGHWELYLPSEETKSCPIGTATFDITAEFIDGNFQTAIYNGIIIVKQKINEVVKNE